VRWHLALQSHAQAVALLGLTQAQQLISLFFYYYYYYYYLKKYIMGGGGAIKLFLKK
jgi:hypothetical protein